MKILHLPYDGNVEMYNYIEGIDIIEDAVKYAKKRTVNKTEYSKIFMTFDIETTKVENREWRVGMTEICHYFSFPFCWQVMCNGKFIFGRDINEFFYMLDMANITSTVIVYVHNLAYEYNNLAKEFEGADIFFKNSSTPLFIRYDNRFEFRCSAQLTHKSLAMLGDEVGMPKLKGDFDYNVQRNLETELTLDEMNYCYRDVAILHKFIDYEAINYSPSGFCCLLPYTQTGYVRKELKKWSRSPIGQLVLEETALTQEEFSYFRKAFYGGYTHAAFRHIGEEISEIEHFDLCSAYPAALVSEEFPFMLKESFKGNVDKIMHGLNNPRFACIAVVTFENLKLKKWHTPYVAYTHHSDKMSGEGVIAENGKVIYADTLTGVYCDVDLQLIFDNYEFTDFVVTRLWTGVKKRLPAEVVAIILEFFNAKCTLKGVVGKEYYYNLSKQMLNAIYGCCAQSCEHDVYEIDDNLMCDSVGTSYEPSKVLPYQLAIWITAYVRRWIVDIITKISQYDSTHNTHLFIYADTDSVFFIKNADIHKIIEEHNVKQIAKLEALQSTFSNIIPTNPKGKKQYLGTLVDEEDDCVNFVTIGAKRYMMRHSDGTYDLTVSGLRATKSYYDEETGEHKNGYNTQRLIDKFDTVEKAFQHLADGGEIFLPFVEGVDKLSNYNTRGEFHGVIDGVEVTRHASFLLYPVATKLSLNTSLLEILQSLGDETSWVRCEIY